MMRMEPMKITQRRRLLARVRRLLRRATYQDEIVLSNPIAYFDMRPPKRRP